MEEARGLVIHWFMTSAVQRLLAVESATAQAEVAVLDAQGHVLAARSGQSGQHHSETLLPLIDAVMSESQTDWDRLTAVAVSVGPGAFTSLRIGVATVKGLCFGDERPVLAVPTLEALAWSARELGGGGSVYPTLIPVLDARRGEVYAAAYRNPQPAESGWGTILAPSVFRADELKQALPEGGCLIGDGSLVVAGELEALCPGRFDGQAGSALRPEAKAVGQLGLRAWASGQQIEASRLVPHYVRRAEAEVKRTQQRFE